jgi:hypothetical protein
MVLPLPCGGRLAATPAMGLLPLLKLEFVVGVFNVVVVALWGGGFMALWVGACLSFMSLRVAAGIFASNVVLVPQEEDAPAPDDAIVALFLKD